MLCPLPQAVENQAINRVHRLGQERPVTVKRILARDTVEETLLDIQVCRSLSLLVQRVWYSTYH